MRIFLNVLGFNSSKYCWLLSQTHHVLVRNSIKWLLVLCQENLEVKSMLVLNIKQGMIVVHSAPCFVIFATFTPENRPITTSGSLTDCVEVVVKFIAESKARRIIFNTSKHIRLLNWNIHRGDYLISRRKSTISWETGGADADVSGTKEWYEITHNERHHDDEVNWARYK